MARLVERGYQGPDLKGGIVDASGRASFRSSDLRANPLGALKEWSIRSPDVKDAFLQADGFGRDVSFRAPLVLVPDSVRRISKSCALAY